MINTDKIRALSDTFRTTFLTGRVLLTAGIQALPNADREAVITKVREYDSFSEDST